MAKAKEGKDKLKLKAATKSIKIATKGLQDKGTSKSAKSTTEITEGAI